MSRRLVRLGLPLALGVLSLGAPAFAQPSPRGNLHVLGLRAPDGDDDAAQATTMALRQAAHDVGFVVAPDSPGLEQEIALFGCDLTVGPACLSQIGTDLNTPRMIYGTVHRIGRGAARQISIELGIWDQAQSRVLRQETATLSLAQSRDAEYVRQMARQLVESLAGVQQPATNNGNGNNNNGNNGNTTPVGPVGPVGPTPSGSHVGRYVGIGLLGVGVALGAVGVVQWVQSSGQSGESGDRNTTDPDAQAWVRYEDTVNANRSMSVSDVCARAETDTSADAVRVRDYCSSNSTARVLAFALGIGGAVVATVGAVLIAVDPGGSSGGATEQRTATAAPRARLNLSPIVTPTVTGASVGISF